jgi:hypothetical protein
MQSVGGSRWRVTSPEPCPRFHAQLYADLSFAAVSWCVTCHRILPFPPPFSSCGGDRRAVGSVHLPGNPEGLVPGEIAKDVAVGFCGSSPNMFSGRKRLYPKGGTNVGIRCIASTRNSSHSTFIPYRIMPACSSERVLTTRSLIIYGNFWWVTFAEQKVGTFSRAPKHILGKR